MSPRPDRRPDSRPERGARRPGGGSSGRPPSRGPGRPGAPLRAGANRRPSSNWGSGEGAGSDRGRPGREAGRSMGEWTPRDRGGDSAGPRRGDAPRFGDRRPERPDFGRPEERRWERSPDQRRPDRGDRFDRRPEAGRPPRPSAPRPTGARPSGTRFAGPRGAESSGTARFLPRGGSRPRPPAELIGLERRAPAGAARPPAAPEGEHFAGAAPSDLIWGRHSAQAALESGRPIHRIWCTPEMRFSPRFLQLLREAKAGGVLVEEVTWARLGQISGGAVHQGIVLQPAAAETLDLPSLIEGCRGIGESPLLIAVDGLTDPQNLGAIVRSAEALGAHGLVLPQRRNAGLTGSVAKVAAGALEHLPVARVVNLNRSLEALKDEGYRVIGLASEGSISLEEADLDGPLVVVTGSEGDGLSLLTRKHCDQLVRIPLRGTTPSLNASVATALLLYEIARRGWMQGLRGNSPAPRLVRPALPAPAAAVESVPVESEPLVPDSGARDALPEAAALQETSAAPAPVPAAGSINAAPAPLADNESAEPVRSAWHAAIGAEPAAAGPEEPTPPTHPEADAAAESPQQEDTSAGATAETRPASSSGASSAPLLDDSAGGVQLQRPDAQVQPAGLEPPLAEWVDSQPGDAPSVSGAGAGIGSGAHLLGGYSFDGDIRL